MGKNHWFTHPKIYRKKVLKIYAKMPENAGFMRFLPHFYGIIS